LSHRPVLFVACRLVDTTSSHRPYVEKVALAHYRHGAVLLLVVSGVSANGTDLRL